MAANQQSDTERTINSTEDFENFNLLFQYRHGCLISQIVSTACELGIFDLLLKSEGLLTSATIAERLGTSTTGMERLLEACVGLKLLKMERKDNIALYGNMDISNLYLAESSPKSQYYYMKFFFDVVGPNLRNLTDVVREGKKQTLKTFGSQGEEFFDALYRSEEKKRTCLNSMDSTWHLCGTDVITAFDLSPFSVICDLGGAGGALARTCISSYPNCTVTILDLPEAVESAKKHFVCSEEHRITFHEGDFFKDPIPEADLYILARVLHFLDDEKCVQLLTKLHKVCKPGGGVLVVEIILNEDRSGPLLGHLQSIVMLLHNEGKERTASEYKVLFSAAGFKEIQVKKGWLYDAILGRK
ncbi:acetylserotonin O-methyltransferase-like [Elgaria multicarinata webbii]|uniref:acetylserotonin O-methyltransferase-like n=1 Tax=Elgaria multicarinata webbii TaxID=159646 RepID=UPI002FCD29C1